MKLISAVSQTLHSFELLFTLHCQPTNHCGTQGGLWWVISSSFDLDGYRLTFTIRSVVPLLMIWAKSRHFSNADRTYAFRKSHGLFLGVIIIVLKLEAGWSSKPEFSSPRGTPGFGAAKISSYSHHVSSSKESEGGMFSVMTTRRGRQARNRALMCLQVVWGCGSFWFGSVCPISNS